MPDKPGRTGRRRPPVPLTDREIAAYNIGRELIEATDDLGAWCRSVEADATLMLSEYGLAIYDVLGPERFFHWIKQGFWHAMEADATRGEHGKGPAQP